MAIGKKKLHMNWPEFHTLFQNELAAQYGEREASSLARIVWEDAFGWKPGVGSLDEHQQQRLAELMLRLRKNEPVQYILGKTRFFKLPFKVTPDVLIPRQETEELVAWVLDDASHLSAQKILDIGTGSGCIAVALKKRRPDFELHALDVSGEALKVASENARSNNVEVSFYEVNILDAEAANCLPTFDTIVSNPPYIVAAERPLMPAQVLEYEPPLALFTGNEDPLRFIKAIANFAKKKLRPGGLLYFELNEFHTKASAAEVEARGFREITLRSDLNGKLRMLRAVRP